MPDEKNVHATRRGVTTAEVVVAMLILGLIAAIAIPRIGRVAAAETSTVNDLRHELRVLRTAIELYHRDHGAWPGIASDNEAFEPSAAARVLEKQLREFTDAAGHTSEQAATGFLFGPYLRGPLPACPIGPATGCRAVLVRRGSAAPAALPDTPEFGWVYNCETGAIVANCALTDERGVRYDEY